VPTVIQTSSQTTENRLSACWRPCWEDGSTLKLSAKANRWFCMFRQGQPRCLSSDFIFNSYRLLEGVVTVHNFFWSQASTLNGCTLTTPTLRRMCGGPYVPP